MSGARHRLTLPGSRKRGVSGARHHLTLEEKKREVVCVVASVTQSSMSSKGMQVCAAVSNV
eukprot:10868510-Prorocentrum_lima.AAC.1